MVKAEAKTHGLDGRLVEPDWPPLTSAEIERVLAQYPQLTGPAHILTTSPRPLSAASVVSTPRGQVFVKRHARAVRDAGTLAEEHRFMAHLLSRGVCVPEVLIASQSRTAIESAEWTYEVHTVPPGTDLYGDAISWTPFFSTHDAFEAGKTLARLHLAGEGYEAPPRDNRPLVAGFTIFASPHPEAAFETYVKARPILRGFVEQKDFIGQALSLLRPFHSELTPCLARLAPLWTHNDLHPSNLFWNDAGANACVSAVIDFGLCDRTNAVHDLAHAIERSIIEWLTLANDPAHPEAVTVHFDHLWALLRGYTSVRRLSEFEAAALAPMLALCHAEFALSEADYFLTALRSEEKAEIACQGYLLGHAAWWRGPGSKLLNELRSWSRNPDHGKVIA